MKPTLPASAIAAAICALFLGTPAQVAFAAAPAAKAPVQAKKAAEAPKPAREVPGAKAPQQAGRGRGGYYSRGAPRNVLKTNSAGNDVAAEDPESGFEGERRGELGRRKKCRGDAGLMVLCDSSRKEHSPRSR